MDYIEAEQVLEAYNTLMDYCSMQESCENCLLTMDTGSNYGGCIMEYQGVPQEWQPLDLD